VSAHISVAAYLHIPTKIFCFFFDRTIPMFFRIKHLKCTYAITVSNYGLCPEFRTAYYRKFVEVAWETRLEKKRRSSIPALPSYQTGTSGDAYGKKEQKHGRIILVLSIFGFILWIAVKLAGTFNRYYYILHYSQLLQYSCASDGKKGGMLKQ